METARKWVKGLFMDAGIKKLQKAAIFDDQLDFTKEGRGAFIRWMFEKNKADFITEVVDPMLAEMKDECRPCRD